jgi:hypothetical protein
LALVGTNEAHLLPLVVHLVIDRVLLEEAGEDGIDLDRTRLRHLHAAEIDLALLPAAADAIVIGRRARHPEVDTETKITT